MRRNMGASPAMSEAKDDAAAKPDRRRLMFGAGAAVAVAALAGFAYYLYATRFSEETSDAYVVGDLVSVTAQQAGRVVAVNFANTQFAHKGDVLVQLDPTDAKVDLDRAKAKLGSAVRSTAGL